MINSLTGYCEFFFTEDEAIDHCRRQNAGLKPGDENCYAVIDGPGCHEIEHPEDCNCASYAVVDLESAKEILDYPESKLPCLVVTD